jgi:hypothetical protein
VVPRVLLAATLIAVAACEENPIGTDQLNALRVQGTVTSTPDDAPIVDMQVGLAWESAFSGTGQKLTRTDAEGRYAVTLEDVFCVPGAFVIVGVLPDGYRLATSDEEPVGVECTEAIQTFDILLEPISD